MLILIITVEFETYLVVKKDEIHLYEDKGHPRGRRQSQQHVVAVGVSLQLPILPELQTRIDHRPDSKG